MESVEYDYDISYNLGKNIKNADALFCIKLNNFTQCIHFKPKSQLSPFLTLLVTKDEDIITKTDEIFEKYKTVSFSDIIKIHFSNSNGLDKTNMYSGKIVRKEKFQNKNLK